MKICLITKRHYTRKDLIKDRYGRLYHLPKYWSRYGASVDVIALDYQGNEVECFQDDDKFNLYSYPSNGFNLGRAKHQVQWGNYDVIIASGHINLAKIALSISKRHGLRSVLDIYDYYPAFLGPLHAFASLYLRHLLPQFDGIIVVSRALEDWCVKWARSVCRVPNGVDTNVFSEVSKSLSREKLSLNPNAYIFGLFGSLSEELGAREVVEAFTRFKSQAEEAQLIVGGAGSQFVEGVEGARSLGMLDQSELKYWASACDCLLIPYRNTLQVRKSQAARLAEYLAIGRPIVVTRTGDAASWFPVNYAGWCDPNDSNSMYQAMMLQAEKKECVPFPDQLRWEALGKKSVAYIQSVTE